MCTLVKMGKGFPNSALIKLKKKYFYSLEVFWRNFSSTSDWWLWLHSMNGFIAYSISQSTLFYPLVGLPTNHPLFFPVLCKSLCYHMILSFLIVFNIYYLLPPVPPPPIFSLSVAFLNTSSLLNQYTIESFFFF